VDRFVLLVVPIPVAVMGFVMVKVEVLLRFLIVLVVISVALLGLLMRFDVASAHRVTHLVLREGDLAPGVSMRLLVLVRQVPAIILVTIVDAGILKWVIIVRIELLLALAWVVQLSNRILVQLLRVDKALLRHLELVYLLLLLHEFLI
jgi:hypothetical protein